MSLPNQKRREMIFQILFCLDLNDLTGEDLISFFMKYLKVTKKSVVSALQVAMDVFYQNDRFDAIIKEKVEEYSLERISKVEKNLLRLSLYELLRDDKISPSIIIAEGVRLCRKFGSPESAKFIHAILDAVIKSEIPTAEASATCSV
jgi:transcription antitermination protein NusB